MSDKFSATRRQVLKGAGTFGLAAAAGLVPTGRATAARRRAKAPRWAMVFDLRRCVGCRACTVACKAEYDVPLGAWNTVVNEEMVGKYPDTKKPFLPIRCNHCEGNKEDTVPPCVKECPEYPKERQKYITADGKKIRYRDGATYKRPDGLILNKNKYCTGCGKCIKACPYGARAFNKRIKSGKDSTKNGITKCTSCQHRIDKGVVPACVNICPGRARVFGDLNDPNSEVSKLAKEFNLVKERDKTTQVPEYYIRQPLVKPLSESRDFKDVVCDLAERMGFPLGFKSAEEFVKISCEKTPGVKEAGGFEYMKKHGVWHDPKAKPKYYMYKKEVKGEDLKKEGVIFDEATGVYWNSKKSKHPDAGYTKAKNAYKGYVGQKIGDKVYKGFKPDKVNKSGYFELYSELLKIKGFQPLPSYVPIPEHEKMGAGELILTTYKVPVHIHSRSANCKWLTEMYHDNPAKINPKTAKGLGIKTGDKIKVKSKVGEITTTAEVVEGIVPGIVAISHHMGHWEYGRYASGKKAPLAGDNDPGLKEKWWDSYGVHPNWIIPNSPDPISGQNRYMDTVVKVTKA